MSNQNTKTPEEQKPQLIISDEEGKDLPKLQLTWKDCIIMHQWLKVAYTPENVPFDKLTQYSSCIVALQNHIGKCSAMVSRKREHLNSKNKKKDQKDQKDQEEKNQ